MDAIDDTTRQSRRHFLKGLAAIGAGGLFAGDAPQAQRAGAQGRPIDVHFHYRSPDFHAAMSRIGGRNQQAGDGRRLLPSHAVG